MRLFCSTLAMAALLAACGQTAPRGADSAAGDAGARLAHEQYVAAINSNKLEALLPMLTDDVVFMSAGEPAVVGKAAVSRWLAASLQHFRTHWDKPVQELVVSGDWAFERATYHSQDTPIAGGPVAEGSGWSLVVYHREADGQWRVARDAWGPDHAATP
jgi:ketosteroid isomerase-like protein